VDAELLVLWAGFVDAVYDLLGALLGFLLERLISSAYLARSELVHTS
jgi:hypothetical protein